MTRYDIVGEFEVVEHAEGSFVYFEDVPQPGTCETCRFYRSGSGECYHPGLLYRGFESFSPPPMPFGCTLHEPLPPAPTPPRGETP